MAKKIQKTNAMRILDSKKAEYTVLEYPHEGEALPGETVAQLVGRAPEMVYKTLVTAGGNGHYVFVVPVNAELDLKKAAKAAGVKSIAMVKVADLFGLTGYVRGGCTPVGMKKLFPTYIHRDAQNLEKMLVSGGKIGLQIEVAPAVLQQASNARFAELV